MGRSRFLADRGRDVLALAFLAAAARAQGAEPAAAKAPDAVIAEIREHFRRVPRELRRYEGIVTYGESLAETAPIAGDVARERELLAEAAAAGLLKTLPEDVIDLGHNLIVHDPAAAEPYLQALHDASATPSPRLRDVTWHATMAMSARGEALAVAELAADAVARRAFWAQYLCDAALYAESTAPILERIAAEPETSIVVALLGALTTIGDPGALSSAQALVEETSEDEVQAAALFVVVELAGFDGLAWVEAVQPIGPKARREKAQGLQWLRTETSAADRHGIEIRDDSGFMDRFADLHSSAAIAWFAEKGWLDAEEEFHPPAKLDAPLKAELLDVLIDSKGFGLEAVKGTLHANLAPEDEPKLLRLRAVGSYSPNELSKKRANSIAILVRSRRHAQGPAPR
jgi:hypothetical protein